MIRLKLPHSITIALAAAIAAVFAVLAPTAAAKVSVSWNNHYPELSATKLYVAGSGGNDYVKIGFDDNGTANTKLDDTVTIKDTTQSVEVVDPGPSYSPAFTQCSEQSTHVVSCQVDKVTEMWVWLFEGNDLVSAKPPYMSGQPELPIKLRVYRHSGIDTVYGGAAGDHLYGN